MQWKCPELLHTSSSVTLNETCSSLVPDIVSDEELGGLFSLLDVDLFKFFQKKICVCISFTLNSEDRFQLQKS